jgi:type II secretory pathway component PulF
VTSFLAAWQQLDDARHRAELYRSWEAAASAGFTVPRAMEMIGPRGSDGVERARRLLRDGAGAGEDLGSIVERDGAAFSPFERGMLTLGSETGRLESALRLLAEFFARKHRSMLAVRKRLAYPLFTLVSATFIAPFPLAWLGHLRAYLAIVTIGCLLWAALGGAIVRLAAERYGQTPTLVMARFARALASAIEAGSPLGRAVRLAAEASGAPTLSACVARIDQRRLDTQPITASLAGCPGVTRDFLAVLATAERTGDFSTTLVRLAELYEDGFR